jgi:hypothetical protein
MGAAHHFRSVSTKKEVVIIRQMKDSVTWQAIPVDTPVVGGYVAPSRYSWPPEAWARFPNSVQVKITPSTSAYGRGIHVLDVESGDATPGEVPGWVNASRTAGQEPSVYLSSSVWAAAINACVSANVAVPHFWIADWNNVQNLPSITVGGVGYTAVAHQYADPAHGSGGNYDNSVVADYWPGVDPAPTEDDVPTYQVHLTDATSDSHIEMGVKGCTELYLHTGYGVQLTATAIMYFGATPPGSGFNGVGGEVDNLVVGNNRPGPIAIPPGAVQVSVRYSCNGPWTLSANS